MVGNASAYCAGIAVKGFGNHCSESLPRGAPLCDLSVDMGIQLTPSTGSYRTLRPGVQSLNSGCASHWLNSAG